MVDGREVNTGSGRRNQDGCILPDKALCCCCFSIIFEQLSDILFHKRISTAS